MRFLVLLLVILILIGFVTTLIRFFLFLASFSSLIFASNSTSIDRPSESILTGGCGSVWRVLRYKGNANASQELFRNAVLFFGPFAMTMVLSYLLFELNAKH